MTRILILGLGGAAGTISRYALGGAIQRFADVHFPLGTLIVNIAGCFLIGLLGTLADERLVLNSHLRLGIFIGFLGAFTTFSTFGYETWSLLKNSQLMLASLNVFLSMAGCFIGLFVGVFLAKFI